MRQSNRYAATLCFLLLGASLFSSCQEDYEEDVIEPEIIAVEPTAESDPAIEAFDSGPVLSALVEPLPKANEYQVRLQWQSAGRGKAWELVRINDLSRVTVAKGEDGSSEEFVDTRVQPGQQYSYELHHLSEEVKKSNPVLIPTDFEVTGIMPLPPTQGINRLFLHEGSKIVADSHQVEIHVNELISDEASIELLPLNKTAAAGQNGRSAGTLILRANSAFGNLRIIAPGENGGVGQDGANGENGAPGSKGAPGTWAFGEYYSKYLAPYALEAERKYMERENPPAESALWKNKLASGQPCFVCGKAPTNGGRGADGKAGQDGTPGGAGGDSGNVLVEVKFDSEFQVDVTAEPGLGAIGGRGGNGGKGGSGGPAGDRDRGNLCPAASPGPSGNDALSGRAGTTGKAGTKKPVCIKIGSNVSGC